MKKKYVENILFFKCGKSEKSVKVNKPNMFYKNL